MFCDRVCVSSCKVVYIVLFSPTEELKMSTRCNAVLIFIPKEISIWQKNIENDFLLYWNKNFIMAKNIENPKRLSHQKWAWRFKWYLVKIRPSSAGPHLVYCNHAYRHVTPWTSRMPVLNSWDCEVCVLYAGVVSSGVWPDDESDCYHGDRIWPLACPWFLPCLVVVVTTPSRSMNCLVSYPYNNFFVFDSLANINEWSHSR